MKPIKAFLRNVPSLLLTVAIFAVVLLPATSLIQGCTAPQQGIAVNTLSTSHQLVDSTIATYFALVAEGKVSTNNVPKVANAYREYQNAFGIAIDAVQMNSNAPAPASVQAAASKILSLTH